MPRVAHVTEVKLRQSRSRKSHGPARGHKWRLEQNATSGLALGLGLASRTCQYCVALDSVGNILSPCVYASMLQAAVNRLGCGAVGPCPPLCDRPVRCLFRSCLRAVHTVESSHAPSSKLQAVALPLYLSSRSSLGSACLGLGLLGLLLLGRGRLCARSDRRAAFARYRRREPSLVGAARHFVTLLAPVLRRGLETPMLLDALLAAARRVAADHRHRLRGLGTWLAALEVVVVLSHAFEHDPICDEARSKGDGVALRNLKRRVAILRRQPRLALED
mmetsp:Transcript_30924/g.90769  ORF Transcript_30924/g.90769 Transcript_30924/m.90769 type:complete len:276 (+) Transcript_30924:34-861(+)